MGDSVFDLSRSCGTKCRPQQRESPGHKGGCGTCPAKRKREAGRAEAGNGVAGGAQPVPPNRMSEVRLVHGSASQVVSHNWDDPGMAVDDGTTERALIPCRYDNKNATPQRMI